MKSPAVLFTCAGTPARSQLAQVLPEHHGVARFRGRSSGLEPGGVNPLTLGVLEERGLPTSPLQARGWCPRLGEQLTCGVTLCDRAGANSRRSWAEIGTRLQTWLGERA